MTSLEYVWKRESGLGGMAGTAAERAVGALAVCAHCHDAGLLKRRASRAGCPCPCLALCCDRTDTRSDWYVRRDARWATEGTTRNA